MRVLCEKGLAENEHVLEADEAHKVGQQAVNREDRVEVQAEADAKGHKDGHEDGEKGSSGKEQAIANNLNFP